MSIPVGTLCLIINPHPLAGRTGTVVRYADRGRYQVWNRDAAGNLIGGYKRRRGPIYHLAGAFPRTPAGRGTWGAEPRHLVPLTPPAPAMRERDESREGSRAPAG